MNIHGYLEFKWDNSVLYVHAFGPFNEEGVTKASNEYLKLISDRVNSRYSIIEIWDEDSLGSPQVMAKVSEMWELLLKNNCVSIAVIVSNSLQQTLCEKLLPSKGRVFVNIEGAEIWINGGSGT
jgi:hypothetical protein